MSAADVVVHAVPIDNDSEAERYPSDDFSSTSTTVDSFTAPPRPAPLSLSSSTSSLSKSTAPIATSFPYFLTLLYAFCVMGFDMALLGPSLLELAVQTSGSISSMSFVFFARSGGLLTGTLVAGYLIDKWPNRGNLLLCVGTGLMMLWTMLFPFITNVFALVLAGYVHGNVMGLIDNTSQVLLIRHYGDKVAPYMQALHGAFGVGAFLSPLILSPFLEATDTSVPSETVDGTLVPYDPAFRYAWIITALGGLPCTLLMVYYTRRYDFPPTAALAASGPSTPAEVTPPPSPTPFHLAGRQQSLLSLNAAKDEHRYQLKVVITVGIFLTLYVGCETGYGGYLYSYAVTQLDVSADAAAYLNSAYWGFFALGRLAGVFVSMRFTPSQMVISDLVGCMIGALINLSWSDSFTALWVGTVIYGFSVGSIYASAINYTEYLVGVNGRLLSYLTFFAALGDAVVPITIGSLFGTSVGPLGMQYVCVSVAALAAVVFGILIGCVAGERGKYIRAGEGKKEEEAVEEEGVQRKGGENGEKADGGRIEMGKFRRGKGKGYAELTAQGDAGAENEDDVDLYDDDEDDELEDEYEEKDRELR